MIRLGPPPRPLLVVALATLGVCTVLAIDGAFRTGISTDEPIHVMRLENFFSTGWFALDWDYVGTSPGADDTNTLVYAPVTMLLLHAWSVLIGVETWGTVSTTPEAYDVRHLGVVLIGLVCLVAVAAIGRLLLRSWRWGIVAAACLAAVPMWTGHMMFNVKDVPVATGHTLVTLALVSYVGEHPPRAWLRWSRAACLVAGLVLTLGTRPGMWAGLAVAGAVAVVAVALASSTRRARLVAWGEMTLAAAVAAGVLVATYPRLFGDPVASLSRTTERSASFREAGGADRFYVPRHLVQEWPTLLLALALSGLVVAAISCLVRWREDRTGAGRLALVVVQAATLPTVAVILGADVYHGLRQLLFFVPAAAVLTAVGIAWWVQRRPQGALIGLVGAAALALPVIDQVSLQPYQTTYVNAATDVVSAGFVEAAERPGGDFWRVSIPELIGDANLDRPFFCKALVVEATNTARPYVSGGGAFSTNRNLDCRDEENGPLSPLALPAAVETLNGEYDAVFLKTVPDNCTPLREVSRHRHGFPVVLTILARCTLDASLLRADGVRVDDAIAGTGRVKDIWRYAVEGWEQWPREMALRAPAASATIAFEAARPCVARGCTLVVEGAAPRDVVATVTTARGATRVQTRSGPGGTLRVPISVRQARAEGGVWVRLARSSGEDLGVTLAGLRWEKASGG